MNMNNNQKNTKQIVVAIQNILEQRDTAGITALAKERHPADIAAVVGSFTQPQQLRFLQLAPAKIAADLFRYLRDELQTELVQQLDKTTLSSLLLTMAADERADLYNLLEPEQQKRLLPVLAQAKREDMRTLAAYDKTKVGAAMTSDYTLLNSRHTAAQAIDMLRTETADKETIYQAYVVDMLGRLIGTVSLRQLLLAQPEERVVDFMKPNPIALDANALCQEAVQMIAHYDLLALPIINGKGQLVGIVTYDDAMDIASSQVDLEFTKTAAIGNIDHNLKTVSIGLLYRKRVVWLVILVFGNIFSGAGIAFFEDTIASYVSLVFFLPLLIDSGGNAGSQSATLMVRALATGEVILKDWLSLLGRELGVAGLLGASMALAVSLLGFWRGGPEIALVVALTMQIVVIIGSLIGMSLPFLLSKLKMDPASASAPLITSIADIIGVLVYFSIATMILDLPVA